MRFKLAAVSIFGALLITAGAAGASELRVEVRGATAKSGNVNIALFDAEGFLKKPVLAQRLKAETEVVVAFFPDLAGGEYAISAFQDLNDNGQLDRNILGRPTEPLGISRDATGINGPPTFDAAKFAVGADNQSIIINLH